MLKITGNEPAFNKFHIIGANPEIDHDGLTIRQHFAVQLFPSAVNAINNTMPDEIERKYGQPQDFYMDNFPRYYALRALEFADALIAELNKIQN